MFREAMKYGLATVIGRLASFILLPLYTRTLTPADYGVLQLLDMTLDIAAIAFSAGAATGILRYYLMADTKREKDQVLFGGFVLQMGLCALGSLTLFALAPPLQTHWLKGTATIGMLHQAAINFTLSSLSAIPMLLMQAERRAGLFSIFAVSKTVLQLLLNAMFLVVFKLGPIGVLYSTGLASALIGIATAVWMFRRIDFGTTRAILWKLYRFGIPYQLATIGTFVLQFGDRFFLQSSKGAAVVGLYGLAYQFGFMFDQLATSPLSRAWVPRRYEEAKLPRAERDAAVNEGIVFFALVAVLIGLCMSLFARPLLMVLSNPSYVPAARVVPLIVLAFFIQACTGIAQFGLDLGERTHYMTPAMWASALVSVALYAWWIPLFGAMGAAAATCVAFAFRFGLVLHFAQRVEPFSYQWRRAAEVAGLAVVIVVAAWMLPEMGVVASFAVGGAGVALFLAITWFWLLTDRLRYDFTRLATSAWLKFRGTFPGALAHERSDG